MVAEVNDSGYVVAAFAGDRMLTNLESAFGERGAADWPLNRSVGRQAASLRCHATAISLTRMSLADSLACGFHRSSPKKNDYTSVSSHA